MPRPRKITPHIARKIFVLYAYGLTDQQIADTFDINIDTIAEFKKNQEYSDTVKRFKNEADLKVINALYLRAIGYYAEDVAFCYQGRIVKDQIFNHAPSEGACINWLANRKKEDWCKDGQRKEEGASNKPTIIRLFAKLNADEITAVRSGENQTDILLGKDFVDGVKQNGTSSNGAH